MEDKSRNERIEFLLRIWMRLENTVWPGVKAWVEIELNKLLPGED